MVGSCQSFVQIAWDRTEPDGYVEMLSPTHRVIIDDAIGDHQVTTLGAHFIARTIGAQNLSPTNREVWGVTDTPGPVTTARRSSSTTSACRPSRSSTSPRRPAPTRTGSCGTRRA